MKNFNPGMSEDKLKRLITFDMTTAALHSVEASQPANAEEAEENAIISAELQDFQIQVAMELEAGELDQAFLLANERIARSREDGGTEYGKIPASDLGSVAIGMNVNDYYKAYNLVSQPPRGRSSVSR